MRQDLKAIVDRVETIEGEHRGTRQYTSQLQAHAPAQSKVICKTRRHLEDLDNRGRHNNIRVRGLLEAEGRENLQLIFESIFN